MLGQIDVLDHGFVRLVDYMGDDSAVVQAARVSYGDGTKSVREDRALLFYLMCHDHTTPFEMCELKFHLKMPISVARQWVRHRTASINEYSTRYSEAPNEVYIPTVLRKQSTTNKQGSSDEDVTAFAVNTYIASLQQARNTYNELIAEDVDTAREQARDVLPLAQYTAFYWKVNLHNLFRFLKLRMDSHAQWEIRQFALAVYSLAKKHFPVSFEAFREYKLYSYTLSASAIELLQLVFMNSNSEYIRKLIKESINSKTEARELFKMLLPHAEYDI